MSQARTVTATFVARLHADGHQDRRRQVGQPASGSDRLRRQPVTPTTTTARSVTLTATASPGSRFDGLERRVHRLRVRARSTMSQARSVRATFVRLVTLEVTVSWAGGGQLRAERNPLRTRLCETVRRRHSRYAPGHGEDGPLVCGLDGSRSLQRQADTTCTVRVSETRLVQARFARELELRLSIPNRLVYHQPHELATVGALATWRGKPLPGVHITFLITCPGRRSTSTLTTGA